MRLSISNIEFLGGKLGFKTIITALPEKLQPTEGNVINIKNIRDIVQLIMR